MPLDELGFNDLFEVEAVTPKELEAVKPEVTQTEQIIPAELEDNYELEPVTDIPAWSNHVDTPPKDSPFTSDLINWGKNIYKSIGKGFADILEGAAARSENAPLIPYEATQFIPGYGPIWIPGAPSSAIEVAKEAKRRGAVTNADYDRLGKDILKEQNDDLAQAYRSVASAYEDPGRSQFNNGLLKFTEDLTVSLARTAPAMAATAASPPAGFAAMFSQFQGEKYKELTDKGVDKKVAKTASDIHALTSGTAEFLGTLFLGGRVKKIFDAATSKLNIGSRVKDILWGLAESGIGEGIEEWTQQHLEAISDTYADFPDADTDDFVKEVWSRWANIEFQKEAGKAAGMGVAGGILLAGLGTAGVAPPLYKNYKQETQAVRQITNAYKQGLLSDDQISAMIQEAPENHPIHKAIQKVQQDRTQAPDNVAGEVTFEDMVTGNIENILATKQPESAMRAEPTAEEDTGEDLIKVQRSSEEAGENTQYEITEGPQRGSSISRGAITQTPEKYAINEELMGVVAAKAKVGENAQLAKDLERLQAAKGNKATKEKVALTHYSPITGLSELEGSPLKSQEQSYSRRDVGKRKDQSTKEYPYVPLVYFYGPNVTPEPSVKSSAQSIYDVEVDPTTIYNGASDPNKYAEQAYKIIQASQGMQPNVINVFSKLVKDAGYKGFVYAAGNNLEERWYVMFDKVPARERVTGESKLQATKATTPEPDITEILDKQPLLKALYRISTSEIRSDRRHRNRVDISLIENLKRTAKYALLDNSDILDTVDKEIIATLESIKDYTYITHPGKMVDVEDINVIQRKAYRVFKKFKQDLSNQSKLQAAKEEKVDKDIKIEKGGEDLRAQETEKAAKAGVNKKVTKGMELSKREKRNVERIKDAIAKGHIKEGSPEYAEVVKKYGKDIEVKKESKSLTKEKDKVKENRVEDITQTKEFKNFFGDSKVVDEKGKPLVVYHGTPNNFDSFESHGGIYFTPSPELASKWANLRSGSTRIGANIIPVYLSIQNPYIHTNDIVDAIKASQISDTLQDKGYDGVIVTDEETGKIIQMKVFSPTQIKSIFNRGTFDTTDPRILFQAQKQPTSSPSLSPQVKAVLRSKKPIATTTLNSVKRTHNLIISSLQQMGISDDVISAINFKYSQLIDLSKIPGLEYATNFHKTSKRNIDVKTSQQVMAATTFLTDQNIIMRFATSLLQDADTITQTGWHEGWHVIEKLGLIDAEAFKAMKELMPNPEDRAEAAREYMVDSSSKKAMKQPNWLRRVFESIKKVLLAIADKLRGIEQPQTYNEILDAQITKLQRQHNRMLMGPVKKKKINREKSVLQAIKEDGIERKTPAPWAFHALTRKLDTVDLKTLPKNKVSLLNWIKKFTKPEEIKWLGIEEYLDTYTYDKAGSINIQDFVDFVKANEVNIEVITHANNITVADSGRIQVNFDEPTVRKVTGYKFKVGEIKFEIQPQGYSPIEEAQLYTLLRDGYQETDPSDLYGTALRFQYNDLKGYIEDELTRELPEDEKYRFEKKEWREYINKILDDKANQVPYEFKDIEATLYDELSEDRVEYYLAEGRDTTYTVYRKNTGGRNYSWEKEGNYSDLPQAQAVVYNEEGRWLEQITDDPYYEPEEGSIRYEQYTLPGGEDYTELLLTWANPPSGTTFKSGHWSEENILAHVRFKTRKDNEGRRVLFIEEVQSDWHQEGKEKGYKTPDLIEKLDRLDELHEEARRLSEDRLPSNQMREEKRWHENRREAEQLAAEVEQIQKAISDAPLRNVWHEVVLKYMLRYAADNQYELMAWTTGKQQNDRYNLVKFVREINWHPNQFTLVIKQTNGREDRQYDITPSQLPEYLGRELTTKLLNQPNIGTSGNPSFTLTGTDLTTGGEGMIEFYDRKIPAFLRKYGKQWGVDIETIAIDEIRELNRNETYYEGPEYTREQIEKMYSEAVKDVNFSSALQLQLKDISAILVSSLTFKQSMAKYGSIALAEYLGGKLITPYTSPNVSAISITPAMSESITYTGQSLFQAAPASSSSTSSSPSAIQKQQLELTLTTGGSTISQTGTNMAGKPFIAMSVLKQREVAIKDRDITLDDLASFWEKNKDALSSNPDLTVGTWIDRETNTTFIDLSLTLPKALQPQIMSLARKFGQKAVFDLSTFSEIFVRNPAREVPTPEEQLAAIAKIAKIVTDGPDKPPIVVTTAKQEALQKTRELLGLDTLDSAEKRSWSEALSQAKEKKYHEQALDIASTVITSPKSLSDIETAGLVIATAQLRNAHESALKQLDASSDSTASTVLSNRISRIEEEFDVLSQALTLSGTEKGRALASQKLAINQNYDLVSILSRAKASKGAPLTPDERQKFEELVKQLSTAQEELDKVGKTVDINKAQQTVTRITRSGLNKYVKMSDVQKDAELVKAINKYKSTPTAEDLVDITLNIGSRPGIVYIDTIVRHINKHLPGVTRSDVVNAIIQTTRHKHADTNEILGKLASIKREARSDRQLQNTIKTLEDILTQEAVPTTQPRIQKAVSDTIQQLRLHRNKLRKEISQSDPVRVQRVSKQINDLTRKLTTGDIVPIPKLALPKSKQLQHLEYQRDKLRKEIRERIRAMKPHTFWDQVLEPLRSARTLKTMLDLSAVLRQGVITVLSHPTVAAKSLPTMFASISSDEQFYKAMKILEADPDFLLAKQAKLYIAERDGNLSTSEEVYVSRWLNKIPGLNFLKDASERAYTIYLNKLRLDTFKVLINALSATGEPTMVEAQAIANYVNVTTGRGTLGALQSASNALNSIFFAPRFAISRFQFILGQPLYQGNARTRKLLAKEYARFLLGALVVLLLGWLAGGDLEDNPQSPDFGKIKFGDTRLDPFGGLIQTTVFLDRIGVRTINSISKIVGGRRIFGQTGKSTSWDTITRFLRGKLSPLTSIPIDIINDNKNIVGEPVSPWDLVTPMSFQDILDVFKAQNIPTALALSILCFFGMGLQTYKDRKRK